VTSILKLALGPNSSNNWVNIIGFIPNPKAWSVVNGAYECVASKVIGSLSSGRVFQTTESYTPPGEVTPVSAITSYALFNRFEALAFYEFVPLQVQVWKDAGNAVWNFVTQMGIACNILQPEIAGVCKLYVNAATNKPFPVPAT